jgi:tRNA-dihydrouridine synthase B
VVKNSGNIPVTVKMRLGWDSNSINVLDFAKMAESHGASSICIHARTKEQMYTPSVDWSWITKVKNEVSIPVVGNGNIFSSEDALNMFNETHCDAVAVARGALGNPWIFEDIISRLKGQMPKVVTKKERVEEAIKYLRLAVEIKGEEKGVMESRKILGFFIKGLYGSPRVRNLINLTSKEKDMENLLLSLLD